MIRELLVVPALEDDELFYSLCGRMHRRLGNGTHANTNRTLFGRKGIRATFDLPSHLPLFVERLPEGRMLDAARLAVTATHMPYYTAFLPRGKRREAFERMEAGRASLHIWLGLNAYLVPQVDELRFCVLCTTAMMEDRGELWWRRDHQLPGVLMCPIHGEPLRRSGVTFWTGGQHGFSPATRRNCVDDAPAVVEGLDERSAALLVEVARRSAALLHGDGLVEDWAGLTEHYRGLLWRKGFCRTPRQVDVPALIDAFGAFWGPALRQLPGVLDPDAGYGRWLLELARSQRKATHPLLHVLFRMFLDSRPDRVSPFGPGPFHCPNPEAGHDGGATIAAPEEKRTTDGIQGTFRCSCGYVYTMSVDGAGRLRGPRYGSFGPLLYPAITRLVGEGKGLRATATALGIHPRAVAAAAEHLGLGTGWKAPRERPRLGRDVRPESRRAPSCRPVRPRDPPGPRIDWAARDAELCRKVQEAAAAVLAASPPTRVCLRSIETSIAVPNAITHRRSKLPLTMARIEALTEDRVAFQNRRVGLAIARTLSAGPAFDRRNAEPLAGVKRERRQYVEQAIADALDPQRMSKL